MAPKPVIAVGALVPSLEEQGGVDSASSSDLRRKSSGRLPDEKAMHDIIMVDTELAAQEDQPVRTSQKIEELNENEHGNEEEDADDDDDEENGEVERLLASIEIEDGNSSAEQDKDSALKPKFCGCRRKKVGKITICCVRRFDRTGFGVVGPHGFGPVCVMGIIIWASLYFVRRALLLIGPISAGICIGFALLTFHNLVDTAFRDPGLVSLGSIPKSDPKQMSSWRFCDLCNEYQPPDGAHCPECNVCVTGYDHHCVWMGTCIGKGNMKQFIRFNLCWLGYLLYAVFWVTFIGPAVFRHKQTEAASP